MAPLRLKDYIRDPADLRLEFVRRLRKGWDECQSDFITITEFVIDLYFIHLKRQVNRTELIRITKILIGHGSSPSERYYWDRKAVEAVNWLIIMRLLSYIPFKPLLLGDRVYE